MINCEFYCLLSVIEFKASYHIIFIANKTLQIKTKLFLSIKKPSFC